MALDFDMSELEGKDIEFTEEQIEDLAKVHLLAYWPTIRFALVRYQSRALAAITVMGGSIETIREAQGRLDMARMLLDLLENQAPDRYKRMQEQDANDSDTARD